MLIDQAKYLIQQIFGHFQGHSVGQNLIYAGGVLLSVRALFNRYFYSYRRAFQQNADAERLRDELVFGDDAKALGVPEDPNPFNLADPDKAGKL
ncbi:MAG: hypothetical protein ABSC63_21220 [Candidatus Binataceae bacterium]|jgi:hypothetical protein